MTTGNTVFDRQRDTVTEFGTTRTGTLFQRTWSGTDWPATARIEKPLMANPVMDWSKKGVAILDKQILANNRAAIAQYRAAIKASHARKVRSRIIEGNKPHPYSCTRVWREQDVDLCKRTVNPTPYTASPTQAGGNPIGLWTPWWTVEDDYRLISRLQTKMVGSNFNAGVFLAELGPALTMITNAASRLYRSRKALIRGDLVNAWRHLSPMGSTFAPKVRRGQPIASQWLEMSYGWMPLINDLEDGAHMIAESENVNPAFYRVRSRVKKGGPLNLVWKDGPVNIFNSQFLGYQYETGQLVAYLREINVPQLVGLSNAASVAWEVTPFSFVADWAVPIGNYLAARGVAQALKGEFVTSKKRDVTVTDFRYGGDMRILSVPKSRFYYRTLTSSRVVEQTLKVPLPQIRPLNEWLNWKRAANAVALLVTTGSLPKGVRGS